jgi:hypothetical protein
MTTFKQVARFLTALGGVTALLLLGGFIFNGTVRAVSLHDDDDDGARNVSQARQARELFEEGKQIFRFDTFGDEAFWGDALQLHRAIAGERLGGVGPGVSPRTALAVGLKVDEAALPAS